MYNMRKDSHLFYTEVQNEMAVKTTVQLQCNYAVAEIEQQCRTKLHSSEMRLH